MLGPGPGLDQRGARDRPGRDRSWPLSWPFIIHSLVIKTATNLQSVQLCNFQPTPLIPFIKNIFLYLIFFISRDWLKS